MKKYTVLKAWEGVKVGEVLEADKDGSFEYERASGSSVGFDSWTCSPADVALLIHAGFLAEGEVKPERWVPQLGGEYFFAGGAGGTHCETWINSSVDRSRFAINNVKRTEEEAQKAAEAIKKALAEL